MTTTSAKQPHVHYSATRTVTCIRSINRPCLSGGGYVRDHLTMNHPCRVPHCGAPASSQFSPHCRRHKSILRRHGGTTQRAITKAELDPYLNRVRRRIQRNPGSPLWGILDKAWEEAVNAARSDANVRIGNRYQRRTAIEIVNIASDAEAREIGTVSLSMFMLRSEQPGRFEGDRAFWHQLARRVRCLSQRHVGIAYSHKSGSSRRLYRELSPRAAILLGQTLGRCFGAAGLQLAELEKREREAAAQTANAINIAIKELN